MKTKIFAILIMLCLTVSMFTVVSADGITVTVNGESLVFDSEPIIENDRLLVPMRVIFEALGADVSWDDSSKTASAVLGNNSVRITIGESVLYKNGSKITLDCSATIKNSRTLLPVRAVSEGLGADVDWNENEKTVIITSGADVGASGEVSESDFQKFVADKTAKTAFETVDLPIEVEKYSADFADDIQNNIENVKKYISDVWNHCQTEALIGILDSSNTEYSVDENFEIMINEVISRAKKDAENELEFLSEKNILVVSYKTEVPNTAVYAGIALKDGAATLFELYSDGEKSELVEYIGTEKETIKELSGSITKEEFINMLLEEIGA